MKSPSSSPAIAKAEYEALAAFRYGLRQFLRFSEDAARGAGLTPGQHQALLAIKGYPGRERITIGELAERLQIAPHSAVGLVNRLSEGGLLLRTHGDEDRRQVYIALTERGADLLHSLTETHRGELHRLRPQFEDLLGCLDGVQAEGKRKTRPS